MYKEGVENDDKKNTPGKIRGLREGKCPNPNASGKDVSVERKINFLSTVGEYSCFRSTHLQCVHLLRQHDQCSKRRGSGWNANGIKVLNGLLRNSLSK